LNFNHGMGLSLLLISLSTVWFSGLHLF